MSDGREVTVSVDQALLVAGAAAAWLATFTVAITGHVTGSMVLVASGLLIGLPSTGASLWLIVGHLVHRERLKMEHLAQIMASTLAAEQNVQRIRR